VGSPVSFFPTAVVRTLDRVHRLVRHLSPEIREGVDQTTPVLPSGRILVPFPGKVLVISVQSIQSITWVYFPDPPAGLP